MWITPCGGGGVEPYFEESCGGVSGELHAWRKDSARADNRVRAKGDVGKNGARKKYFGLRISKRVVALAVVAVMCISAVVAGLVFWNLKPKVPGDASSNSTNTGTYDSKYTGLFIKDPNNENAGLMGPNGVNKSIAVQLANVLENAGVTGSNTRDASHFGASVPGVDEYGNGAIYVRLFDSTGSGNTQKFTTSESAQGGGARWWRAVYAQNGTITFWMAEGYKLSSGGKSYTSTTRTDIKSDFSAVESTLHADAKALIASPGIPAQADAPSAWESYYGPFPNPEVPAGDKVFLPSVWEIANNSTSKQSGSTTSSAASAQTRSGQWNLSGLDRGSANHSWVRSNWDYSYDNGLGTSYSGYVGSHASGITGTLEAYRKGNATNNVYLRPATRLSLTGIQSAAASTITYYKGNQPGVSGTSPQTYTKTYGTSYTIAGTTLFSRTGYTQIGWATTQARATAGTVDYASTGTAKYTAEEDLTLYPVWQILSYNIKYLNRAPDGTGSATTTETKNYGESYTIKGELFQAAGYRQIGWTSGGIGIVTMYAFGAEYTDNRELVLYPVWEELGGMVTLHYVGGINDPDSEFGEINTTWYFNTLYANTMVLPSVVTMNGLAEKAGHSKVFVGWYEDAECTIEIVPDPVTGKILIPVSWAGQVRDVYAKWSV